MNSPFDFSDFIYLDNAATTFPKPPAVLEKAAEFYKNYGVNPGRAGYDIARYASELVDNTRLKLTQLFGGEDPNRLIFCSNATDAINLLLRGLLNSGDHVITTALEHNSVIRPLHHLIDEIGISVDFLPFEADGCIDPNRVRNAIRQETRLVIVTHASNVLGTIQPIAEIGSICSDAGVYCAIDAAQTAGAVPINIKSMQINAVVFTGHKNLLGLPGIGGLYFSDDMQLRPTRTGGTGVRSSELRQPNKLPFLLEAGSLNLIGIAGLHYGLEFIQEQGMNSLHTKALQVFKLLQEGLASIKNLTLHSPESLDDRMPVLNFTIEGMDPEEIGTILDVDFGIGVRTGLHCAPLLHQQIGTAPRGSVRMSTGAFNNSTQIQRAIKAVETLAGTIE